MKGILIMGDVLQTIVSAIVGVFGGIGFGLNWIIESASDFLGSLS